VKTLEAIVGAQQKNRSHSLDESFMRGRPSLCTNLVPERPIEWFSHSQDPTETWAAQDFRSAKSLFVPSLKRDIVPPIACTRPPAGGSHGNPHPTARIHIHTGRRSSCVAARGARAAAGAAGRRPCQPPIARCVRAPIRRVQKGLSEVGSILHHERERIRPSTLVGLA